MSFEGDARCTDIVGKHEDRQANRIMGDIQLTQEDTATHDCSAAISFFEQVISNPLNIAARHTHPYFQKFPQYVLHHMGPNIERVYNIVSQLLDIIMGYTDDQPDVRDQVFSTFCSFVRDSHLAAFGLTTCLDAVCRICASLSTSHIECAIIDNVFYAVKGMNMILKAHGRTLHTSGDEFQLWRMQLDEMTTGPQFFRLPSVLTQYLYNVACTIVDI
ncbi:hypothetical protein PROFUN_06754 [Planoprotostelium fungivorum]|uniref:Uncharacterized protein n=1 Tax=Planoprotostelium fungivorum TaxID=1890364 RepID=A0A2P6NNK6_9EUKA|nr:hypothetical protein PROFUN_06754 [Planoprotostelium fungivorum]